MGDKEKVFQAALAGLLHDIGKFAQRAGEPLDRKFDLQDVGKHGTHAILSQQFIENYVPKALRKGLSGVLYHHRPDLDDEEIARIRLADHLAAGERRTGSEEQADITEARLVPILTNVELLHKPTMTKKHRITPLTIEDDSSYPVNEKIGDFRELWTQMIQEIKQWKQDAGENWEKQSLDVYYFTLLALFQKYLWCVPSATPWQKDKSEKPHRAWPDVSLYDHNRLTSAIAACLAWDDSLPEESMEEPIALLVRGDVSGIQSFIYRLQRPDSETAHIAKRLRGRSFYVQMLAEVTVDWILRELNLPESCAIFIGGGRFDLLLPLGAQQALSGLQQQLSRWLHEAFYGELGLLIAWEKARAQDFSDTRVISRKLDEQLEHAKRRKWVELLSVEEMARPQGKQWHVCKVCQLTPMDDSGQVCNLCSLHASIGKALPHVKVLAYCYTKPSSLSEGAVEIFFTGAPFNSLSIILLDDLTQARSLPIGSKIYAINDTHQFIIPGYASAFRFLANAAPKARKTFKGEEEEGIEAGDVLHFEAISQLSTGAERLGILKADVDRLGLVMSEGLNEEDTNKPNKERLRPTLSRVASLSRMLDLFFAGHLNRICRQVSLDWEKGNPTQSQDTDGIFYILYSGGDDLFVIGPWDWVLRLALRVRQEFLAFSGDNPDLTISAGYIQVKPRYPIQKAADFVDEAEKQAKQERNHISAFRLAMDWSMFETLLQRAIDWVKGIEDKDLPSGLIYDLGALFRQHVDKEGNLRPLWTPQLYYTLARRLKKEIHDKYQKGIFDAVSSKKVLFPVSVASLMIRERSK